MQEIRKNIAEVTTSVANETQRGNFKKAVVDVYKATCDEVVKQFKSSFSTRGEANGSKPNSIRLAQEVTDRVENGGTVNHVFNDVNKGTTNAIKEIITKGKVDGLKVPNMTIEGKVVNPKIPDMPILDNVRDLRTRMENAKSKLPPDSSRVHSFSVGRPVQEQTKQNDTKGRGI